MKKSKGGGGRVSPGHCRTWVLWHLVFCQKGPSWAKGCLRKGRDLKRRGITAVKGEWGGGGGGGLRAQGMGSRREGRGANWVSL
jgi:hypothetical protein